MADSPLLSLAPVSGSLGAHSSNTRCWVCRSRPEEEWECAAERGVAEDCNGSSSGPRRKDHSEVNENFGNTDSTQVEELTEQGDDIERREV
jgi:hypothetical protein